MEVTGTPFMAYNIRAPTHQHFQYNETFQEYFSLSAPPDTKIWRKPGSQDNTSAPMVLTSLHQPFILAEVTVSVDLDIEGDQAGLVIFAGASPSTAIGPSLRRRRTPCLLNGQVEDLNGRWAKASVELSNGEPVMSSTVANPGCGPDWTLTPLCPCDEGQMQALRVKLEKVDDSLWIWYKIPDSSALSCEFRSVAEASMEWRKVREVSGFFNGVDSKYGLTIGCYVSRPMPLEDDEKNVLFAEFEDLDVM